MHVKRIAFHNLNGSSIAEVVTAMLIISLSMALTGMLFTNVFGSSARYLRHEAWFTVNEYVNSTIQTKDVEESEYILPRFSITKNCVKEESVNDLWKITINAISAKGKVLATRRFMIEVPTNIVNKQPITAPDN